MILTGISEKRLIKYLQTADDSTNFQRALRQIDRDNRDAVWGFLRKNFQLETEEIEDIYYQTLEALVDNVRSGKFKGAGSIRSYMTGAARNMALTLLKYKGKHQSDEALADRPAQTHDPEEIYLRKEIVEKVSWLLDQLLGANCASILRLWADDFSFREIAQKLGYNSESVARTRKHYCLQELIQLAQRHNFTLEFQP